jgi:6-phospho-beta-glucosidase
MKMTLIGGGGVRSPLFVASALRRYERINLDELCLMDIDSEKLHLMGGLCQHLAERMTSPVNISTTTDPREALQNAAYVVTSIRVGKESGRVLDEKIALRHGVLGQETTGPGGFAMALRSIPALLAYAELIQEVCPQAWMFNFTNPAGLVTQALQDAGYERTVGICDGANLAQHAVANWMNVDYHNVKAEVYGLNHLSWTRAVYIDGKDQLAGLLNDPDFLTGTELRVFEPELVKAFGVWLNEYLYYYYYAEQAVKKIQRDELTRGEEVLLLNNRLLNQLRETDISKHPTEALKAYYAYEERRTSTYMHYARPDSPTIEEAEAELHEHQTADNTGEGYAGVALDIIEAFESDSPAYIGLNVPNQRAISCMQPDDVVEIICRVDAAGIHPQPIGEIPEDQELLMRAVKYYERRTVNAIQKHSRQEAIMALMTHPLVVSYSLAKTLVDEYLEAHAEYIGAWT